MPYTETHEIVIGPITLPEGVTVEAEIVAGTGGQQAVRIHGVTRTTKDDTVTLLQAAFAELITAATIEGVGEPVFVASQSLQPSPVVRP